MELKDILIQYRTEQKISQREFARRSNLSNAQISILENGINKQTKRKPALDLNTYKKIADGMGITLQTLFEKIGNSETISLTMRQDSAPVIIPDTELFRKIMENMAADDYYVVMDAFNRTFDRMKEEGKLDDKT